MNDPSAAFSPDEWEPHVHRSEVTGQPTGKIELRRKPDAAILREPTKPETRIGWWFMLRFRPKTVALRTARNRIMAEAYAASERYDLPELRDALHAYGEAQE